MLSTEEKRNDLEKKKGEEKRGPQRGNILLKERKSSAKGPKERGNENAKFCNYFFAFSSFELKDFFFHMCDKEREGKCCFRKITFGEKKKIRGGRRKM